MAEEMHGKTVLVSGAGSGIGRAAALLLARVGAAVAVADLALERAQETAGAITAAGGKALAFAGDVSKEADIARFVSETVGAFGRLDGAFNNAGISPAAVGAAGTPITDWQEEAFSRVIAVNLTGVFLAMKHEIAAMAQQEARDGSIGAIVNTASVAGLVGLRGSSAYVASKHGVIGLTRTAALEYAPLGIRVNAVCPGYIDTPMVAPHMPVRGEDILRAVPFARLGTPEEIAELVLWLLSDRASFVTGAAYVADGGYSAA
jgi:NAD(P)-dependent dehydrogenase (short-subunit alcohol dehydrogenase family)